MKLLETQLEEAKKDSIFYKFIWILYLVPILSTFWLIKRYGVDVPVWVDQWSLVDLFEAISSIDLSSFLAELWELNNNHRMIFPKIIFAVTAFFSNWNIFYELYWSFSLALITFLLIYKLSEITNRTQSIFLFHATNIMTCFLMFSWVQYSNWLWGFQIALYLINFCVILAIFILASFSKFNSQTKLKLAGFFCIISSFSSAQGLMSWLALIPSISTLEGSPIQKTRRLFVWLTSFIFCSFIYSIQYNSIPVTEYYDVVSYNSIWDKFRVYIHFFLNVVAAPLTGDSTFAWILGLIVTSCFLFLFLQSWIERPSIRHPFRTVFISESAPWISLGLFSILCSFLMTIGRADIGADYGLVTSRYTSHSILLTIAVIHLFYIHLYRFNNQYKKSAFSDKILVYSFCLGLITSLMWVRSYQSLNIVKIQIYQPTQSAQSCLYLINYLELEKSHFFQNSPHHCLSSIVPTTAGFSEQVQRLQKINLRNFAEDLSFVEEPDQIHGFISSPWTPEKSFSVPPGGIVKIDGWAILPNQPQQPQLVFLSLDNHQSFFASAYINLPSPDIIEFMKSDAYQNSRWEVSFSADNLTSGENIIKAWIYDPKERRFVKLSGEMQITIQDNQDF